MREKIIRYQKLPENFFDIIRRRELKLDECFIAIYLRGKCGRYGNPFYLTDKEIQIELSTSRYYIRKIIYLLQKKGVIKFERGKNKNYPTTYTMLDSIMIAKEEKSENKGVKLLPLRDKNFTPSIYTNNDTNKDKNKTERFLIPKDFKKILLNL